MFVIAVSSPVFDKNRFLFGIPNKLENLVIFVRYIEQN